MISFEQYNADNVLITKAIKFATKNHEGQLRKGSGFPYIIHPMEVWQILRNNDCSVNVQVAGLLHDTLEDTKVTSEEIETEFGKDILAIVQTETEDKSKSWQERKQHTIDHLASSSKETKMVCCADKLSNCRAQLYDYNQIGDKLFDRFNKESKPEDQAWYYKGIVEALKPLCGMKMYEELKEVVGKLYKY